MRQTCRPMHYQTRKKVVRMPNLFPSSPSGRILTGWILILLCSLLLYDALLYASLRSETRRNAEASASVAVATLKSRMSMGVRFGKKLETYRGVNRLLASVGQEADLPLAVLDTRGGLLHQWGNFPRKIVFDEHAGQQKAKQILPQSEGSLLLTPVADREGRTVGYLAAWIADARLDSSLRDVFFRQLLLQGALLLAGTLLLGGILWWRRPEGTLLRNLCLGIFLLTMLGNGTLALHTASQQYTRGLQQDADYIGSLLSSDLNRLLLVGVSLDSAARLNSYLTIIAATHDDNMVLDILRPDGQIYASSHAAPRHRPDVLADGQEFALSGLTADMALSGDVLMQGWKLRVSLARAPWLAHLVATGLDILTLVAIALIFMVEMFLLLSRSLDARLQGTLCTHAHRSSLFRPLMFVFVLAMDMTISFIPLRMADLTPSGTLSRDVLLGLPISAEMGMTGLSVLIAGAWMKRRGARPPLVTGILCMALGYLASMLAWNPWLFIAARALVGLGYGLSLLTAQAYTVRDGRLADMFAGVYAGSLCGSALGAMLAERLGYGPVFALSALILACLVLAPLRMLRSDGREALQQPEPEAPRLTLVQIRRLLSDRRFLGFTLLALLPSALLCVGFLNYFLPVFLKAAQVSQSNIGRVYMLNCLIVIYSGPLFAGLVTRTRRKDWLLFWAGVLSALSVACFWLLPPLMASVCGSILLGLATGLNIPAQSEYLLELDIARAIGVDQTMSLLDALQRVGQVMGPLCVGALLAVMSVDSAAHWVGIGLLVISLLFLLLARPSAQGAGDRHA